MTGEGSTLLTYCFKPSTVVLATTGTGMREMPILPNALNGTEEQRPHIFHCLVLITVAAIAIRCGSHRRQHDKNEMKCRGAAGLKCQSFRMTGEGSTLLTYCFKPSTVVLATTGTGMREMPILPNALNGTEEQRPHIFHCLVLITVAAIAIRCGSHRRQHDKNEMKCRGAAGLKCQSFRMTGEGSTLLTYCFKPSTVVLATTGTGMREMPILPNALNGTEEQRPHIFHCLVLITVLYILCCLPSNL
ncbi:hypothetical protein Tcan_09047 [Toxocara canis]|uniref:Uncharacterized protein n=1 Tax=Toxocara canis TaxID=6265 RepID=A0A0B2VD97_TOXCA|nr:hypothetical protein Tcan_09047 [Toxocara canis]